MQTATIIIKGMTCMGCVNSIKTVLKNVPGVIQADVTLEPAQAIIQYDSNNIKIDQIKEAIVDAGFEVIN
ncbi:heavy-metal-associated domain-containing protein [Nitrosomonas supralitoralis]|uniref:Heavy metal transporter n=1 Tax=Nitrosomonas supralitoralis TaxID=2116706 RepID=A0A2P7NWW4_9PROT|nr:heavy-metal-associated domain-containing protein [Nitrosomonas supralitoralis]PSJ17929.1 heavy metal transporter [Nitrosomonas supralitoralis]